MNLRKKIITILTKCVTGVTLTVEESIFLEEWKSVSNKNIELFEGLMQGESKIEELKIYESIDVDKEWQILLHRTNQPIVKKNTLFRKILPYAAVLGIGLLLYLANYDFTDNSNTLPVTQADTAAQDLDPATQGATLILADGRHIELDQNTNISNKQGLTLQASDSELKIAVDEQQITTPSALNVMIVPKGAYYTVILADHTKVWVNANSKLTFPSAFTASERRVKIEGEAFFEVSHDSKRPFYVEANGTQIKVLGTKFNVNTYRHQTKTTLEEGNVELSFNHQKTILSPGQCGQWNKNTFQVDKANLAKELAWKNKEFYFENDDIVHIAYELSRWYDVQVKFAGNIDMKKEYSGTMGRELSLAKVLNVLQFGSDFEFKIQDNELLIMNK